MLAAGKVADNRVPPLPALLGLPILPGLAWVLTFVVLYQSAFFQHNQYSLASMAYGDQLNSGQFCGISADVSKPHAHTCVPYTPALSALKISPSPLALKTSPCHLPASDRVVLRDVLPAGNHRLHAPPAFAPPPPPAAATASHFRNLGCRHDYGSSLPAVGPAGMEHWSSDDDLPLSGRAGPSDHCPTRERLLDSLRQARSSKPPQA